MRNLHCVLLNLIGEISLGFGLERKSVSAIAKVAQLNKNKLNKKIRCGSCTALFVVEKIVALLVKCCSCPPLPMASILFPGVSNKVT